MSGSLRSFLLLVLLSFLFVSGCKDSSLTVIDQQNESQSLTKAAPSATLAVTTEGFETGSKTAYAAANVTLGSGVWNLNNVLIGTSSSDIKNGTASARMTASGKITMQFDRTTGASTITIKHAKYGSDATTTWGLWYSTNSGSTWTQTGSSVSTTTTTLATATFTVNISGTIRFDIRKSDGTTNRTNIDDIAINDYATSNNPVPVASTLSPSSAIAGGAVFTLTVTGSNFISSSAVKWNGTALTTTYVSATQLTAPVPAANITTVGTASVTVFNTTPGGGTSSALTFTIGTVTTNPVPVATSLNPSSATAGGSAFTLTVTGSSFISSSAVKWNGTALTTTYTSATQLTAAVPATNIATAGTATITVFNTTPGGGTSAGLTFTTNTATTSTNVNLAMGNPTGATVDVNNPLNYLLDKPQFCASYNRDKGISNWVAWQLNSTWCTGSASRKDNFIPDALLPTSYYHVTTSDYTGSGFSRGHMCPSADRINTQANNDALFVMTNMIPQNQNNNGGIWDALETYCRTLANAGNTLYIYSGGYGSGGTGTSGSATTIASGKVTVPAKIWKVIIVIPNGTGTDLSRVTSSTRTIAVIMNNADPVSGDTWQSHRVSVDAVESLTGFDFFSNVSTSIQTVIEAKVDNL